VAKRELNFSQLGEYKICISSKAEIFQFLRQEILKKKKNRIVTLNPEFIALAERNQIFKKAILSAEILIPDGIGLVFLLRLKNLISNRKKKIERIPGIEFALSLLEELFEKEKHTIGFLGAKPGVLEKTISFFLKKDLIKSSNIVFKNDGYFGCSPNKHSEIVKKILAKKPDFLLVALSFEKQEKLINELYEQKSSFENLITIGLGGSFDIWSSSKKRSPQILRKLNLEWLWRVILEPSRTKRLLKMFFFFLIFSFSSLRKN